MRNMKGKNPHSLVFPGWCNFRISSISMLNLNLHNNFVLNDYMFTYLHHTIKDVLWRGGLRLNVNRYEENIFILLCFIINNALAESDSPWLTCSPPTVSPYVSKQQHCILTLAYLLSNLNLLSIKFKMLLGIIGNIRPTQLKWYLLAQLHQFYVQTNFNGTRNNIQKEKKLINRTSLRHMKLKFGVRLFQTK